MGRYRGRLDGHRRRRGDELQVHAGAALAVRLPDHARGHGRHLGRAVPSVPALRLAIKPERRSSTYGRPLDLSAPSVPTFSVGLAGVALEPIRSDERSFASFAAVDTLSTLASMVDLALSSTACVSVVVRVASYSSHALLAWRRFMYAVAAPATAPATARPPSTFGQRRGFLPRPVCFWTCFLPLRASFLASFLACRELSSAALNSASTLSIVTLRALLRPGWTALRADSTRGARAPDAPSAACAAASRR